MTQPRPTPTTQGHHDDPCGPACGSIASERNRYFTGKYMTARDFADEQTYLIGRRYLHNRLLHGWGIVCGLDVRPHPNPDCANCWVEVQPGVALDCCGRELVLTGRKALKLPLPACETADDPCGCHHEGDSGQHDHTHDTQPKQQPDHYPEPRAQQDQSYDQDDTRDGYPPEDRRPFIICLRYHEEKIERVPVLHSDHGCDPSRHEHNRIRESVILDVCHPEDYPGCWPMPGNDDEDSYYCRGCDDDQPDTGCLDPNCPCGQIVPLALVTPDPDAEHGYTIDMTGRHRLPTPPEWLTHIVWTNWQHGGTLTLSDLRDRMRGRLEVRFDRQILDSNDDGVGVNVHTFVVQYAGAQRGIEFVRSTEATPAVENDCMAVFEIEPGMLSSGRHADNLAGNIVYVTLRCDFILDCHHNPVDGDHLRGRLPTGNGVEGGIFESWFHVVADGGDGRPAGDD